MLVAFRARAFPLGAVFFIMGAMSNPRSRSITSSKNPLVQGFSGAATGEDRSLLLAEGPRLVREGLRAGLEAVAAAVAPSLRDQTLGEQLRSRAVEFFECSDSVLARLSALDTHQGVAVLFARPRFAEQDLLRGDLAPLVVAVAGVRDPGNLGALLRSAEAAGVSGILTLKGGADPWRDKAVRGSMGSVFRLPVEHGRSAEAVVRFARNHKLQLVVADGEGAVDYTECDFRHPILLVLGGEARGVPAEIRDVADQCVRVPLRAPVESLNVAVAAGVLLFEARRQRQ